MHTKHVFALASEVLVPAQSYQMRGQETMLNESWFSDVFLPKFNRSPKVIVGNRKNREQKQEGQQIKESKLVWGHTLQQTRSCGARHKVCGRGSIALLSAASNSNGAFDGSWHRK